MAARKASEKCAVVTVERDRLESRLALVEEEGRRSRDTMEAAHVAENKAKAANVDLQDELRVEMKARSRAENDLRGLSARVSELEASSKVAEVEQKGRLEKLEVQLEAARSEGEQAKGSVSFLTTQAEDLRRQLEEAQRENESLRRTVEALRGTDGGAAR